MCRKRSLTTAAKLRVALKQFRALKIIGAHDALSARLIERAGFDGVWASGFAISSSLKCIPEASFITLSEQLDVERNIVEAVTIPVIADCDTGYDNALNIMRTVNGVAWLLFAVKITSIPTAVVSARVFDVN